MTRAAMPSSVRSFGLVLGFCLLASPLPAADLSNEMRTEIDCFPCRHQPITVERFVPETEGKHPTIILLHAIDGLETGHGPTYRNLAKQFAARDYVVLLVHYFDATGPDAQAVKGYRELFLDFANLPANGSRAKEARDLFERWVEVAAEAVKFARLLPDVDGDRIGLVGFSMGAFVGVAAAGRDDTRVAAVVDFFGGLHPDVAARIEQLPPTLIIHGNKDRTVPVKEAYALHGWMMAQGLPSKIKVFKGVDHMFWSPKGVDLWSVMAAQALAADFLKNHLRIELATK